MRSSIRFWKFARHLFAATSLYVATASFVAAATTPPTPGSLRELYPTGSIDSVSRADAALAATGGAKARIEREYRGDAQACLKNVLVNDCLDRARALQRQRTADVDTVELEANRFKRRDKGDRLEADRVKREADRAANAKADEATRARSRKSYDDRQVQSARDAADRARSDAGRAHPSKPHRPAIKVPRATDVEAAAKARQKNAADQASKVRDAAVHRAEIDRRATAKVADRKRRAAEKAERDAKAAAAAAPKQP